MLVPVALKTEGDDKLVIEWSDGQSRLYQWADLRGNCPCATCNDERSRNEPASLLPVLSQEEAKPVRPESMNPVGRYAYQIYWNDGHKSGIFTFDYLRQLGQEISGNL